MKKHLHNSLRALFLSLAVLLSLPMLAVEVEINGINYDLDTETDQATVIAKSSGTYSGEVVIPESVEHESVAYSVTSIGEEAFYFCSVLTSVTIPNSVTSIGNNAFRGCSGLTSVTIGNSVTSIGDWAFYFCFGLTSVTIPNSVTSIGDVAFLGCSGLTSVVVEDGNPVYDSRNNCNAIIETATNTLHSGCKTTIIPNSVTSIGDYAFNGCSGLTSVTIPNSVTSIGDQAFYGCSGLTSVTIPNTVTSIGSGAFIGCSGLTSIVVEDENSVYDSRNNSNAIIETATNTLHSGCKTTIIPNSVTSIGDYAFFYCSGLTSVTIPNSVTSIADEAFSGCSGLTSVTIPNSVTSIGANAFSGCSGLTSVTIGNGVESIGQLAFANCSKLHDVYCYAENVPSTESNTFESSPIENATLHVPDASINSYKATEPWSGFGKIVALLNYEFDAETKQATVIAKSSGKYSGEVVIPESVEHDGTAYSVTSIGGYAFYDCSGLTSVTIPYSVTSIGGYAFYGCSGLTSVTIPNSVTSIGNAAFQNCSSLTSVHISDIAAWCNIDFADSYSNPLYCAHHLYLNGEEVKDLVIPNSMTSIGDYAFRGCSGLTSVTIPNSVTSIGNYAFDNCSGLTSVTIPNSVTRIGDVAFWGCSGLTSVTIPNSVTSIGQEAFEGCSGLTSVTIGNSVTSIGSEAFANCTELLNVYCYAENVPSTGSNAFSSLLIANATLHVPAASINSYEASAPWSGFGTITPLPDLTLTDGEEFENNTEQPFSTLTYTRTLPNMLWNPLYVPFKIPYEDLEENYEVAYINAMHSYDNDDNGEIDEMVMEIVKIKAGTLKPNHPYLIKAKNEEAKVMNIVQEAATLYPAEITTLDCSSVYTKFEITGTYQEMTSGDLNGSLVISTDGAWKKLSSTSTLKPFRFYLTISSREGSPVEIAEEAMSRVRIRVMGEDDNATGIDEVKTANDEQKSEIYDLSGRRVSAPAKGGVYVINGKKVIY